MSRCSLAVFGIAQMVLIALVSVGCNDDISDEDYERIRAGMTYEQVVDILGKPDKVSGGGGEVDGIGGSGKFAVWNRGGRKVTITFVNDKVTVKTISGSESGRKSETNLFRPASIGLQAAAAKSNTASGLIL